MNPNIGANWINAICIEILGLACATADPIRNITGKGKLDSQCACLAGNRAHCCLFCQQLRLIFPIHQDIDISHFRSYCFDCQSPKGRVDESQIFNQNVGRWLDKNQARSCICILPRKPSQYGFIPPNFAMTIHYTTAPSRLNTRIAVFFPSMVLWAFPKILLAVLTCCWAPLLAGAALSLLMVVVFLWCDERSWCCLPPTLRMGNRQTLHNFRKIRQSRIRKLAIFVDTA